MPESNELFVGKMGHMKPRRQLKVVLLVKIDTTWAVSSINKAEENVLPYSRIPTLKCSQNDTIRKSALIHSSDDSFKGQLLYKKSNETQDA